jgi:hypothetical protein
MPLLHDELERTNFKKRVINHVSSEEETNRLFGNYPTQQNIG